MDFCKLFNAQTAQYQQGTPLRTEITVKSDKTFTFQVKAPPTSWLMRRCLGVTKGASKPGKAEDSIGTLSLKHIYEIAKMKQKDTPWLTLEQVAKTLPGSARSCGIVIKP